MQHVISFLLSLLWGITDSGRPAPMVMLEQAGGPSA